jgi:hypothetical protein
MTEPLIVQRNDRWEFAKHHWFRVAVVAACKDQGADWIAVNYPHLSREEIADGMAWTFPPIHDAPVAVIEVATITCRCGESLRVEIGDAGKATCALCGLDYELVLTATTRQ